MSTSAGATLHVDGRCTGILVRHATTFWTRARGLWAEAVRQSAIALELRPCYAVHTFGMSGAIDIAFVDGEGRVLAACHRLKPWRVVVHPSAVSTWELPAGACLIHGVVVGARLHEAIPASAERQLLPALLARRDTPRAAPVGGLT